MNLNVSTSNEIYEKCIFKVKPLTRNGLLLNIIPIVKKSVKNIRFTIAAFHHNCKILALVDNNGNVFVFDYGVSKFWKLPSHSCSSIKFSSFNTDELFIALYNGDIKILMFNSEGVSETIKGHKTAVKNMSFAGKHLFLSSSEEEAILWDLRTYTMLQVLDLDEKSHIKFTCFIPMCSNILACFEDDVLQVWNSSTFETIKTFSPKNWKNFSLKTLTFTKNGQIMVIAGYAPILAFVLLENWKLHKFVNLSEYMHGVRYIEFIPQPFDAGFNKILAILSNQGVIYFYNADKNCIVNELKTDSEVRYFSVCSQGNYVACILHCGNSQLYNIQQYVEENSDTKPAKVTYKNRKQMVLKNQKQTQRIKEVKYELENLLNKDKLKMILLEYWEYPEIHRLKIWEHLLELPNNYKAYNTIINHITSHDFEDPSTKYPLENKVSILALKKLISNLITWCPFFANVDFMPVFAFPFVKVFQNKPIDCFESVCTILINWCQHWFEYHPLTPFNILAIVENILYEHDPELLSFYAGSTISSNYYAWPLLSSAFSEVFLCSEWLCFWDHVFTNEVSFLLCAAAAYNVTQRDTIMKMKSFEELKCFFENQNPIDLKRFLKISYFFLNNTIEENHPRQYLRDFKGIGERSYPIFKDYPVILFDLKEGSLKNLQMDLAQTVKYESEILARRKIEENEKRKADLKAQEHEKRIREMEKVLLDRIKSKDTIVKLWSSKLQSIKGFVNSKKEQSQSKVPP